MELIRKKRCTGVCGQELPLACFFKNNGKCKPCYYLYRTEWRVKNPEKALAQSRRSNAKTSQDRKTNPGKYSKQDRKHNLKGAYGISIERFNTLFAAQHGVCAICGQPNDPKPLFVDHDHATGAVRGLLCTVCNMALNRVECISNWAEKAKQYLEKVWS